MHAKPKPAPTDPNEPRLLYHPELDRHIVTPIANLEVLNGWIDAGEPPTDDAELAAVLAIPAVQGQPTDSPAVTGDPTVADGDEKKE